MGGNQTTRGELNAAKLINLSTNKEVNCMFNPYEYAIAKTNNWDSKRVSGLNLPYATFEYGGPQTLQLTLYFDTQAANTNVRDYTGPIWTMMMIDKTKQNSFTKKAEPPPVAFVWGKLYFKAIITSLSEKFTLFNESGIPVRSEVTVALQQYIDETELSPQVRQQVQQEFDKAKSMEMTQGERMDNVAVQSGGKPSDYRAIAEKNNVDNPLNQPSGKRLKV